MKSAIKRTILILAIVLLGFTATGAMADILSSLGSFASGVTKGSIKGVLFMSVLSEFVGIGEAGYCWFCSVYTSLFDAMNTIARTTMVELKTPILGIFGVGLLLWIPLHVSKTLTQLQEVDAMQFLQEIMKRFGRALIAVVLIAAGTPVFHYVLNPILELTMLLSNEFITIATETVPDDMSDGLGGWIISGLNSLVGDTLDSQAMCTAAEGQLNYFAVDMNPFSESVKSYMLCMLQKVSASLITGMVVGAVLSKDGLLDAVTGTLPNVGFAITGILILGTYLLIYISFPFKMIDAMVRLTFVAALMPIWIALWVFPATVEYTKNAWNMFLGSCILFLTLSVIMVLIFYIIQEMMPDETDVFRMLMEDMHLEALSSLAPTGKNTITTAALGFLAWKLLGSANALAQSFSKTPDLGMGAAMDSNTTRLMSGLVGVSAAAAGTAVMGGSALSGTLKKQLLAKRGVAPTDQSQYGSEHDFQRDSETARSAALRNYQTNADEIADRRLRGEDTTSLEARQREIVQNITQAENNLNQVSGDSLRNLYTEKQNEARNLIASGVADTDPRLQRIADILQQLEAQGFRPREGSGSGSGGSGGSGSGGSGGGSGS